MDPVSGVRPLVRKGLTFERHVPTKQLAILRCTLHLLFSQYPHSKLPRSTSTDQNPLPPYPPTARMPFTGGPYGTFKRFLAFSNARLTPLLH